MNEKFTCYIPLISKIILYSRNFEQEPIFAKSSNCLDTVEYKSRDSEIKSDVDLGLHHSHDHWSSLRLM